MLLLFDFDFEIVERYIGGECENLAFFLKEKLKCKSYYVMETFRGVDDMKHFLINYKGLYIDIYGIYENEEEVLESMIELDKRNFANKSEYYYLIEHDLHPTFDFDEEYIDAKFYSDIILNKIYESL